MVPNYRKLDETNGHTKLRTHCTNENTLVLCRMLPQQSCVSPIPLPFWQVKSYLPDRLLCTVKQAARQCKNVWYTKMRSEEGGQIDALLLYTLMSICFFFLLHNSILDVFFSCSWLWGNKRNCFCFLGYICTFPVRLRIFPPSFQYSLYLCLILFSVFAFCGIFFLWAAATTRCTLLVYVFEVYKVTDCVGFICYWNFVFHLHSECVITKNPNWHGKHYFPLGLYWLLEWNLNSYANDCGCERELLYIMSPTPITFSAMCHA